MQRAQILDNRTHTMQTADTAINQIPAIYLAGNCAATLTGVGATGSADAKKEKLTKLSRTGLEGRQPINNQFA